MALAGVYVGMRRGGARGGTQPAYNYTEQGTGKTGTAKGTLRVYNYSYYIDPTIIDGFSSEYGIEVVYDEYEAAEEAYAKLQLGGGGYDLVVLTDSYLPEAIRRGLIQRIDHGRLSNFSNLDQAFLDNLDDPGLSYSVPYAWGTTGIGVNYHYLRGAGLDVDVDSWAYLFDEGKLRLYRKKASMLEEAVELAIAAKIYMGLDVNDWSNATMDRVIDLLRRQKPYLAGYFGASRYVPGLVKGEVWVAQAWSGDVLWARDEFASELEKRGEDVSIAEQLVYAIPREGMERWTDYMVIPRDARNVEAAYLFMDYLLRPEVAARNVNYTWYPSPVRRDLIWRMLEEDVRREPAVYPTPEVEKKLFFVRHGPEAVRAAERVRLEVMG